jgi:DNA polymerase-3 subunit epsilon
VLDRELRRYHGHGFDVRGPIIDPFVLDKHLDKWRRGKRTLSACCEHYGVKLEGAHTSAGDALAACRLAWRLATVYPEHLVDLSTVNEFQAECRATWAAEFSEYLAKQGKPEDVDGHWPIRPLSVSA